MSDRPIARTLLRLYPGTWRARYGDELLAYIEDAGLTWRSVANIIGAAGIERGRSILDAARAQVDTAPLPVQDPPVVIGVGTIYGPILVRGALITMIVPGRSGPSASSAPVRVGGNIAMPRKLHDVAAIYPESMRSTGITGNVILDVIVEKDGTVRSVRVLRPSDPALDEAAVDAVKQWRYEPVSLNGAPVPIVFTASVVVRP